MARWSPSLILPDPPEPGFSDYMLDGFQREMARRQGREDEDRRLTRQAQTQRETAEFEDTLLRRRNAESRAAELERTMRQGTWRPTLFRRDPVEVPGMAPGIPPTLLEIDRYADPDIPGYFRDVADFNGKKWHRWLANPTQRTLLGDFRAEAMMTPEFQSGNEKLVQGRRDELTPEESAALVRGGVSPNVIAGVTMPESERRRTPQVTPPPRAPVSNPDTVERQRRQDAIRQAEAATQIFVRKNLVPTRTDPVGKSQYRTWAKQNPQLAAEYQRLLDAEAAANAALTASGDDPSRLF